MTLPAIEQRPTPIRRRWSSWADAQSWIDRRLEGIEQDLGDSETMQSLGSHGTAVLQAKRALLLDIAFLSGECVEAEAAEQATVAAQDGQEARWRDDPSLGAGGSVEAFRG